MSLTNIVGGQQTFEDVDPGYISESAMEALNVAVLTENLTPDEMEEFVSESSAYDIVTEKNIVKLDKNAKKQRAYKVAILQCAAEDNRKEYKKLRKLWQLEAINFKKLEKIYKNKAMARAKESMRMLGRSKSPTATKAATRGTTNLKGAKTLLGGGVNKSAKK